VTAQTSPRVGVLYRAVDREPAMSLPDIAKAAEERGFDSLVLGEHTHIPVSRETEFIGEGDLPDDYARLLDPYIGLAFVAATTSLRIGTCVSLVAEHDPIALAKALATLDFLSGGRLTLGVGFGWNREELVNHGHAFSDRRQIVREYVELMRTLWSQTVAEYHGSFASLAPSWSWPKPAQPIPVLLGAAAAGDRAIEAVAQWADGWMIGGSSLDWLEERCAALSRSWLEAGRPGSGPVVYVIQQTDDGAEFARRLDRYREMEVAEVLCDIPTARASEILPILDRYAAARSAAAPAP
jgi:probable F420-dependent oxidoreductase